MTKKCKFKKDIRQPSIVKVLTGQTSSISDDQPELEPIDLQKTTNGNNKRRRNTTDSSDQNSSSSNNVKKDKKIPRMANIGNLEETTQLGNISTNVTDDHTQSISINEPTSPPRPGSINHPSQAIESIIPLPPQKENPTDIDLMEIRLTKNMQAMLKPIQDTLAGMSKTKETVERHVSKIKHLENENWKLNAEVKSLKHVLKEVHNRITSLENKSLDKHLIFHGIEEDLGKEREDLASKIYQEISQTINRETEADRIQVASEIEIIRARRLGKKEDNRVRPISVEFSNKFDVEQIYANRFDFNEGIYVDRQYSKETDRNWRLLRPILQAAKKLPEYKGLCRLEEDVLNLNGTRFTKENLHELPPKLNIIEITTKKNANVIGFFGEICPFSNFYPSKFYYKGIEYHSSEQFIQHAKAKFFGDKYTERVVLNAETALACKRAGREVSNYDHKKWCKKVKEICKPGIDAKFCQNPTAMQSLLETGDKMLVECTKDNVWGNGYPLGHPNSLRSQTWKSKGVLGIILEEIRDYHLSQAKTMPWMNIGAWSQQPRLPPPLFLCLVQLQFPSNWTNKYFTTAQTTKTNANFKQRKPNTYAYLISPGRRSFCNANERPERCPSLNSEL